MWLAFFITKMATLWDSLKPGDRQKLVEYYQQQFGKEFILPKCGDRPIQCDTKLESLKEIDKLMRQKPHGRMGRG